MRKSLRSLLKTILCMTLIMTMSLSTPISHLGSVFANKVETYADEKVPVTPGPDESQTDPEEVAENTEETAEPVVLEEKVDLRDANKKYFEMSDGTTKVCIYPQSVHYLKDGEYEEIDNTLEYVEVESIDEEIIEETLEPETTEVIEEEMEATEEPVSTFVPEVVDEEDNITPDMNTTNMILTTPVAEEDLESTEMPASSESVEVLDVDDMAEESDEDGVVSTEDTETSDEGVSDVTEEPVVLPSFEEEITVEPTVAPTETEESIVDGNEELLSEADSDDKELSIEEKEAKKKLKNEKTKIKGSHYKNKSNSFDVLLPEDYSDDYTEFSDENGYVRFKLVGTSKAKINKEKTEELDRKDKTVAKSIISKSRRF